MKDELINYLKQALSGGMSEDDAIQTLVATGWNEGEVRIVLATVKSGPESAPNIAVPAPVAAPPARRAKPLILIVDDEKDFSEIMSLKLKAAGMDTAIAHNGKDAVVKALELMPDLILMDIHMPGETGTDVALAIKQNPKTSGLKIAFLTNLKDPWPAMAGDKSKVAQELGMEDFLEKTQDLEVLAKKVQAILSGLKTDGGQSAPGQTV